MLKKELANSSRRVPASCFRVNLRNLLSSVSIPYSGVSLLIASDLEANVPF